MVVCCGLPADVEMVEAAGIEPASANPVYGESTIKPHELVLVRQCRPSAHDRVCKPHGWRGFYLQTGFTELPVSCDLILSRFSYND